MFSYRISWSWSVLSRQKNDHQPLHGVPLPGVFLSPIGLIHLSLSCVPYVDSANHPSGPYKHHVVHLGVLLKSVLLLFFCSLRLCCFHRASGRTPSEKIEIRPAGLHLEGQCYDRQEVLLSNRALWCITSTLWKTKTGYCCWDFFSAGVWFIQSAVTFHEAAASILRLPSDEDLMVVHPRISQYHAQWCHTFRWGVLADHKPKVKPSQPFTVLGVESHLMGVISCTSVSKFLALLLLFVGTQILALSRTRVEGEGQAGPWSRLPTLEGAGRTQVFHAA